MGKRATKSDKPGIGGLTGGAQETASAPVKPQHPDAATSTADAVSEDEAARSAVKAAKKAAKELRKAEKKRKRQEKEVAADAADASDKVAEESEERPSKRTKKRNVEERSERKSKSMKKGKAREADVSTPEEEISASHPEEYHGKESSTKKKEKKRKGEAEEKDAAAGNAHPVVVTNATSVPEKPPKKDKKSKAKREEAKDDAATTSTGGMVEGLDTQLHGGLESGPGERASKKLNKNKHSKEKDISKPTHKSKSNAEPKDASTSNPVGAARNWNINGLAGGNARQAKFLQLLGGKKNGLTVSDATGDRGDLAKPGLDRVEQDLSKQYEAGVRQKFEAGGPRRGLGA